MPMDLWVDAAQGTFGLEAEPSYETTDPKAVDFTLDGGLQLEVVNNTVATPANTLTRNNQISTVSIPRVKLVHSDLPTIRFLPDGSVAQSSPQMLHLTSGDGGSLWLALSRDAVNYEIRNTDK
jgi:hypothetical protein